MLSAQEQEFYMRNIEKGLKNYIVESCFVNHTKYMSWKKTRRLFNLPRREKYDYDNYIPCEIYNTPYDLNNL